MLENQVFTSVEAALRDSEEKFRLIAETSPDAIYQVDANGILIYASPAAERLFGYAPGEALGTQFAQHVYEPDMPKALDIFRGVLAGETVHQIEIRVVKKDGALFFVDISGSPVKRDGKIVGCQGISRNITERKQAEQTLREKDLEIEMKNMELKEINKALKKLIKQKEEESENVLRSILENVQNFVRPYIKHLKESDLDAMQRMYLNVIETNLYEITEPFSGRLGKKFENLTEREIEVANLIRMGKTSGQIAKFLQMSKRSVDFHRNRLREKLGLKNKKHNLRQFLVSLMN